MFSRNVTILRFVIAASAIGLMVVSQAYWFVQAWRLTGRAKSLPLRGVLRSVCVVTFGLLLAALYLNFRFTARRSHFGWRNDRVLALTGLWFSSALFAFLAVKFVGGAVWVWDRAVSRRSSANPSAADLPRRRFVQSVTVLAGSLPFVAGIYGFAFERTRFGVRQVELPLANLPAALNGMRIAQISDIHMSSYMSAADVRRAVDMTNALGADLTVVTGDFITGVGDPLEDCITELSRLHAPLGVWGCNGNHEIYAGVEARAAELFDQHGMRLLRQQRATLTWRSQPLNLIGVDYETVYDSNGNPRVFLSEIEELVRRDMPNILLSHNPNTFPRAAELGIELMLTGHTHGGQVRVEILHHNVGPARFFTPYVAGLFNRPLGAPPSQGDREPWAGSKGDSILYVNRGLGTIGMPVRLGVPPEITLHTLRRA